MIACGVDHRRDRRGLHQRRRAAAEEDRGQRAAGQQPRFVREVGEQRLAPRILVDALADMAVEVAIGAFADAERPVDVERERLAGHSLSAATSLRNASARWLILCFSQRLHLAEGLLMPDRHEHRIVAEALVAARRPDQRAVDPALEGFDLAVVGPGDRQRAGEMRVGRGVGLRRLDLAPHPLHRAHPVAVAILVLGPARGEDAGPPVQARRRTGRCRRRAQEGR